MKKLLALALATILAFSLCIPAAAYSDEYWEGYDEGWNDGNDAGMADAEAGVVRQSDTDTHEQGYKDGYRDGYDGGYESGAWSSESDADYQKQVLENLTAHGGVAGEINVMVNGKCLQFAGARPENVGGHIMVPARAILEALGAEVSYDGDTRTVTATLGDRTISQTIGTDTVERTAAPDTTADVISMGCKSYIKNGLTMVPVRFISEALGYCVGWDADYQTVAVIDTDAFETYTDGKLSILNLLLADQAAMMQTEKNLCRNTSLDLDLTLFDTLNGNRNFSASGSAQVLIGSEAMNGSVQINMSQIMDLLAEENYFGADENVIAEMQKNLSILKEEIIYNRETDEMYIKSPLLDDYVGEGNWLESSMGDLMGVSMDSLLKADTMGKILLLMQTQMGMESPFLWYDNLYENADRLIAAMGDENFKTSGKTSTLTLDNEALEKLLDTDEEYMSLTGRMMDEEMSLTLRVTKTGDKSCDYALTSECKSDYFQLKLSDTKTGGSESITADIHVKNICKATLKGKATTTQSSASIQTEPPAEAVTMNLKEMYS